MLRGKFGRDGEGPHYISLIRMVSLVILVLGYQWKRRRPELIPAPSVKTEIHLLIESRDAMNSLSSDLADGLDASSSGKPPPTDPPE